jgi:glyoxylase-like metal-dependent hydrolase (beta-lactamase superfamily II)
MVETTIDVIDRGYFRCDLNYMIEGNTLATRDDPNPDVEFEPNAVYNLVIDHPEGTILYDTGIHHDAADGYWPEGAAQAFVPEVAAEHRLDDDLAEEGWSIDDIDYVFMTHLHIDHAGGLEFFDGTDTPVFVHEDELKWAHYSANTDQGDGGYLPTELNHDLNWEVVKGSRRELFEDIEFWHQPGHTPGLMGMKVEHDSAGTIMFAADEVYRRTNYVDEVALGAGLLWSRPHWEDCLADLKELDAREDPEMIFGHDPDQFEEIEDGWP